MIERLLIFDLDGTLLDAHGAGHAAMEAAFREVYGVSGHFDRIDFAGRTDPAVLEAAAQAAGLACPPETRQRLEAAMVSALERVVRTTPVTAMPGAHDLLAGMLAEGRTALAVGTGNVEAGAWIKLKAAGLAHFFPVGGFGSDAVDRASMLAAALRRAQAHYALAAVPAAALGDTPRDVEAAHANHIGVVGVATGQYSIVQLEAAGADAVVADLTDADAVEKALARALAHGS